MGNRWEIDYFSVPASISELKHGRGRFQSAILRSKWDGALIGGAILRSKWDGALVGLLFETG